MALQRAVSCPWPAALPVLQRLRIASDTSTRTARHHGTRHHRMYMMSVNRSHKGSKLAPASNARPLSEWLHRP